MAGRLWLDVVTRPDVQAQSLRKRSSESTVCDADAALVTIASSMTSAMDLRAGMNLEGEHVVEEDWLLLSTGGAAASEESSSSSSSRSSSSSSFPVVGRGPEDVVSLAQIRLAQAKVDAKRRMYFDEFKTGAQRVRSTMEDRIRLAKRDNIHQGIYCKLCTEVIRGARWMCKQCPRWNVCEACLSLTGHNGIHPHHSFLRILLEKDDIYPEEAEDQQQYHSSFSSYVAEQRETHWGIRCSSCKEPVVGARYDCAIMACRAQSTSFCEDCEALPVPCHPLEHPLIKYKKQKYLCQTLELPGSVTMGQASSLSGEDVSAACRHNNHQETQQGALRWGDNEADAAKRVWLMTRKEQHKLRNRR